MADESILLDVVDSLKAMLKRTDQMQCIMKRIATTLDHQQSLLLQIGNSNSVSIESEVSMSSGGDSDVDLSSSQLCTNLNSDTMALDDHLQSNQPVTLMEHHALLGEIYYKPAQFPIPPPIELSDLANDVVLSHRLGIDDPAPLLPRFNGVNPDKGFLMQLDDSQSINFESALQVFDEMPDGIRTKIGTEDHHTVDTEVLYIQSDSMVAVDESQGKTNVEICLSKFTFVLEHHKLCINIVLADDLQETNTIATNICDVDYSLALKAIHSFAWDPGLIMKHVQVPPSKLVIHANTLNFQFGGYSTVTSGTSHTTNGSDFNNILCHIMNTPSCIYIPDGRTTDFRLVDGGILLAHAKNLMLYLWHKWKTKLDYTTVVFIVLLHDVNFDIWPKPNLIVQPNAHAIWMIPWLIVDMLLYNAIRRFYTSEKVVYAHRLYTIMLHKWIIGDRVVSTSLPSAYLKVAAASTDAINTLDLLSLKVGILNCAAVFDKTSASITGPVELEGLTNGSTGDVSFNRWTYQIGLQEDTLGLITGGSSFWVLRLPISHHFAWYMLDDPSGDNPLEIDFTIMGKGDTWVNGLLHGLVSASVSQCNVVIILMTYRVRTPVLFFMGGGMQAAKSTTLTDILHVLFWVHAIHVTVLEASTFQEFDVTCKIRRSRDPHELLQYWKFSSHFLTLLLHIAGIAKSLVFPYMSLVTPFDSLYGHRPPNIARY